MSVDEDRHRYQSAAAVLGRVVEAKAEELLRQIGEVQQLVWTDVQRWTVAAAQTAAQTAAGTAHAVVAWSASMIGAPFGAGSHAHVPPPTVLPPDVSPPDVSPPAPGDAAPSGTHP